MKKYIVDGGILVNTPFFKYSNVVAGYGDVSALDGEQLPTNRQLPTGERYLLIDDKNLQTIFAEYHTAGFFTTGYCWAPLFHKTYEEDYKEFTDRLEEARLIIRIGESQDDKAKALLSRYAFFAIMCAFDTFVADTILTRIVNEEKMFYSFAESVEIKEQFQKLIKQGKLGDAEKEVMDFVLKQSYCS